MKYYLFPRKAVAKILIFSILDFAYTGDTAYEIGFIWSTPWPDKKT